MTKKTQIKRSTNHISVRLDDDLYREIEKLADEKKIKKSGAVRLALSKELAKVAAHRETILPEEDRATVLRLLGVIQTEMSRMRNDNAKMGRNINQMAKATNSGGPVFSEIELDEYKQYGAAVERNMASFAKGVNQVWRTLESQVPGADEQQ